MIASGIAIPLTVVFLLVSFCDPARSLDLQASASLQEQEALALDKVNLATGGWDGASVPTLTVEGQVLWQAWRVVGSSRTSFQLIKNLRDQLEAGGYETLFQCQSVSCGGYDFRFAIGHFKAPNMFVDLGDYHYLSARKGDTYTAVLVSRSSADGFIEFVQVTPEGQTPPSGNIVSNASVALIRGGDTAPLSQQLEIRGRAVLTGLKFTPGSSKLEDGDVPILAELAAYLKQNQTRKVVLVGHTDAKGSLAGNIALSRKRAASVITRLIELHGVDATQVSAEGVGFLMPLAANLSTEARALNRRVEVVLISTE